MESDRRSYRVALVAEAYVNPLPGEVDAMEALIAAGWGVIQLPADAYPTEVADPLLAEVAEQAEEFHRHGYDLVVIGSHSGLDEALEAVGISQLEGIAPGSPEELYTFLRERPEPSAIVSPDSTARSHASATSSVAKPSSSGH